VWMVSPAARVSRCDRARLPDAESRLRARIRLARVSADPAIRFPGESDEYRLARNRLLEAEIELRRTIERVAAQRRALPPGGAVPEDYVFEEAAGGGGEVRFSELFAPDKDTLVIYSFMFPRWSGDTRPGPAEGETARLPLAETPCPSCTSILDSLDGAAPHLASRLNLVVVAKSDPARIRNFAGNAAGASCGFCPRGTTTTTATTTRNGRTASRARS